LLYLIVLVQDGGGWGGHVEFASGGGEVADLASAGVPAAVDCLILGRWRAFIVVTPWSCAVNFHFLRLRVVAESLFLSGVRGGGGGVGRRGTAVSCRGRAGLSAGVGATAVHEFRLPLVAGAAKARSGLFSSGCRGGFLFFLHKVGVGGYVMDWHTFLLDRADFGCYLGGWLRSVTSIAGSYWCWRGVWRQLYLK